MIEKFGHFELQKYLQLMAQLLHKLFFLNTVIFSVCVADQGFWLLNSGLETLRKNLNALEMPSECCNLSTLQWIGGINPCGQN